MYKDYHNFLSPYSLPINLGWIVNRLFLQPLNERPISMEITLSLAYLHFRS